LFLSNPSALLLATPFFCRSEVAWNQNPKKTRADFGNGQLSLLDLEILFVKGKFSVLCRIRTAYGAYTGLENGVVPKMRARHKVGTKAQDLKSQNCSASRSLCSERSGRILTSLILCEEEMRHLTCEISQT
jgi:hypothetical protein